jgi:hypothetical protein
MTYERVHKWFARLILWQCVVAFLVGWIAVPFTEPWTNWNILSLACQAVLTFYAYRGIRRHEALVASWVSHFFRRFER